MKNFKTSGQFGFIDKKIAILIGFLAIVAVVAYIFFDGTEPPPPPGKGDTELSLNGIDVGIELNKLNKIFRKKADSQEDFGSDTIYRYGNLKVKVQNNKVMELMTDDPNFETPKGIHVGSTYGEVVSAYGQNSTKTADKFTTYEYLFPALNDQTGVLKFSVKGDSIADTVTYIDIQIIPRNTQSETAEQAKLALNKFLTTIARGEYDKAYDNMLTENYKKTIPKKMFGNMCQQLTELDFNEVLKVVSVKPNSVVLGYSAGSRKQALNPEGKYQTLYTSWTGEIEMVNEAGYWKINIVTSVQGESFFEK